MIQLISNNADGVRSFEAQIQTLKTSVSVHEAKARTGSLDFNDCVCTTQLLKANAEQMRRLLNSVAVVKR